MSDQPSITTAWTCECGYINSIENRFCPKCGHGMPSEISRRVYEEEILIHNGILIDKNKRILIITAAIILCLVFLRTVLFAISMLTGIFSLMIAWLYIRKSVKDVNVVESQKLKKCVNFTFGFSLFVLVVVRIAASSMRGAVHTGIVIFLLCWIIMFVLTIVFFSISKKQNNITITQKNIWTMAWFYIPKLLCLAIIMWLI